MIVYLLPSALTLAIYYYFERNGKFDRGRGKLLFLILFFFMIFMAMFRLNIGVDYGGYLIQYERIKIGLSTHTEIGFYMLVKALVKVYDDPKIMFALFSFFTLINFLSAIYKQSQSKTLSIFMFIALGYYNLTYNAIRYYFALSLVFLAYGFLEENKKKRFILTIFFAACFHKTALLVIPVALFLKQNINHKHLFLFLFAIGTLVCKEQIWTLTFRIYPSYIGTVYVDAGISLYNVLKGMLIFFVGILYKQYIYNDEKLGFLYRMNIVALILYTCCSWIPELSRIGYYFNITNIVFLPNLIHQIRGNNNKIIMKYSILVACSIYLVLMLGQSYSPRIHLLPYETWLF